MRITDHPAVRELRPHAPRALAALVVLVLVLAAAWARWSLLASSPSPLGIDGFYYPIQLRSLLREGRLYYPTSPLVFWLMLPGAWALGPIAGAKLGAAIGTALAAIPVYAIVRRATGERAAGVLGAAIVATSAGSAYLAAEFVKQGVGCTLALAFVAALASTLDAPRAEHRWRAAVAALLFVATLLAHPAALGLAMIVALPPLYVAVSRSHPRAALGAMIAAPLVVAALLFVLVPAAFHDLRLAHLFGPATLRYYADEGPAWHHEVELAAVCALAWLGASRLARSRTSVVDVPSPCARALLVGPALFALALAFPWLSSRDPEGLGFRLRVMAFVPLATLAPAVIASMLARAQARVRTVVPLAAAAIVVALLPMTYADPVFWPNTMMLDAMAPLAAATPPDAIVVVADRQTAFMVRWAADREARTRPPAHVGPAPTFRLASAMMPVGMHGRLAEFERTLPPGLPTPIHLVPAHALAAVLFAEPTWQALLAFASPDDRARLEPWPAVE